MLLLLMLLLMLLLLLEMGGHVLHEVLERVRLGALAGALAALEASPALPTFVALGPFATALEPVAKTLKSAWLLPRWLWPRLLLALLELRLRMPRKLLGRIRPMLEPWASHHRGPKGTLMSALAPPLATLAALEHATERVLGPTLLCVQCLLVRVAVAAKVVVVAALAFETWPEDGTDPAAIASDAWMHGPCHKLVRAPVWPLVERPLQLLQHVHELLRGLADECHPRRERLSL
mmetsp:Transcript_54608/g.155422  ORF Transcript_54608/g.155422 Transcript_54608/m.155422 type:complete len:234 (-) Transcript_54608:434-1135(-)